MKKIAVIVIVLAAVGCAKKIAPAGSGSGASSSMGNGGKVISSNTPASSTGSAAGTGTTPAASQSEGTGAKVPAAPPATVKAPEVQGQSTYNAKCGKCHGLKVVNDYTADRWASIMAVMGPKAQLNDAETTNVLAYVRANAKK